MNKNITLSIYSTICIPNIITNNTWIRHPMCCLIQFDDCICVQSQIKSKCQIS